MDRPRPVKEGFAAGTSVFCFCGRLVGMGLGLEMSLVHRGRSVDFEAAGNVASTDVWVAGSDGCAL